jgi:regulator of protease activity HflC (stomatin/prohibitin superfamily)
MDVAVVSIQADIIYDTYMYCWLKILTKDSVTVAVDAVVYYRIQNPMISVCNVEDASRSTRLLAQTTLRNILGTKTLSEILTDREQISQIMQVGGKVLHYREKLLVCTFYYSINFYFFLCSIFLYP